ncbi:hypothetical protein ACHAXH_009254 [Discostella pseudostelligera]
MSLSLFDVLPEEVLRSILRYMDIPSLAAISNTHKAHHRNVAYLASDDVTWYRLIQARFGIGCNHRIINTQKVMMHEGVVIVKRGGYISSSSSSQKERRPTSYGGKNWKDVYQAFSCIMRIPETSVSGASQRSGSGAVFASPYRRSRNSAGGTTTSVGDFFGVWCMVNHAENCRTRTIEGQLRMGSTHHGRRRCTSNRNNIIQGESLINLPYRTDRRYIELKLCLQNTKSGYGRIVVPDVSSIRFASLEEEDYFSFHGWDQWNENHDSTFQLIKDGPWAPKIILRRRYSDTDNNKTLQGRTLMDDCDADWNASCGDGKKDLIFHPFDVVVLSVHISCPETLVYETDALSSMSSIRVPVVAESWPMRKPVNNDGAVGTIHKKDTAVAHFLPEDDLWEYYCQLPGGCLSLTDRSRLIPV